jgi:hypothetical protein
MNHHPNTDATPTPRKRADAELQETAEPCYDVRYLFASRFQVTNPANNHRHYVGVAFLEGEFIGRHECLAKRYGSPKCSHEREAERHERQRLNQAMSDYFNG